MNILTVLKLADIKTFSFVDKDSAYDKTDVLFSLENVVDVVSNGKITSQLRDVYSGRDKNVSFKNKFNQQMKNLTAQLGELEKKDLFGVIEMFNFITYDELLQVLCICCSGKMIESMMLCDNSREVCETPVFSDVVLVQFEEIREKYCVFHKDHEIFFSFEQYYEEVCVNYEGYECIEDLNNDELNELVKEIKKTKLEKKYVKKFVGIKKKTERKKKIVTSVEKVDDNVCSILETVDNSV